MKSLPVRFEVRWLLLSLSLLLSVSRLCAVQSLRVAWDRSPDSDVTGYNVYYGEMGATGTSKMAVGNNTTGTLAGLVEGKTYFAYVTACGSAGIESQPSEKVTYTVTSGPNTAPTLIRIDGETWTTSASSSQQVLVNGSFESGTSGWTLNGNVRATAPTSVQATDGTWLAQFNGGNLAPNGTVSQSFPTTPGQTCTLEFDLGVWAFNLDEQRLQVTVQGTGNLFSQTYTLKGNGLGTAKWTPQSATFVADSSTTTLTFRDVSIATVALDLLVDNVRVTGTVSSTISSVPTFTIASGSSFSATVTASDSDLPANVLTFGLAAAPSGASISSKGVFTWTPSPAQAGSTNLVTVQVTDNGVPPLSDSKSFQIVVGPSINTAPVLPALPDQAASIGTPFHLQLVAIDQDMPVNKLTYSLISGPQGATLDSATGVFEWTPSSANAGGAYVVEVEVKDNGIPPLSDRGSFVVVVARPNSAPVLAPIQSQMVKLGSSLTVYLSATDPDVPVDKLTFSLVSGPAGISLDPATGLFKWTPSQNGIYPVTIQVTDDGTPKLSDSKSFSILVEAPNAAPSLAAVGLQNVREGSLLQLNLTATDDGPVSALVYSLVSGPAGASVSASGLFSWTPTEAQGPSTNVVTVKVTDGASPALSDSKSFTVVVSEVNAAPVLGALADLRVSPGQVVMVAMSAVDADLPASKLTYRLVSGPSNSTVDPTTGIFTWRLSKSSAAATYKVTVAVADNGTPSLSDTKSFNVIVQSKNSKSSTVSKTSILGTLTWVADLDGGRRVRFAHPLQSDLQPQHAVHFLEVSEDLKTWVTLGQVDGQTEFQDPGAADAPMRFYRVRTEPAADANGQVIETAATE